MNPIECNQGSQLKKYFKNVDFGVSTIQPVKLGEGSILR